MTNEVEEGHSPAIDADTRKSNYDETAVIWLIQGFWYLFLLLLVFFSDSPDRAMSLKFLFIVSLFCFATGNILTAIAAMSERTDHD